ncbi:MAG: cytochrome c-type biogenesis protein [Thermanaerothrix sp.]|jgi:cytochrome c-type biogenesis protein CcmH|uniref:Cytochrome c-type biogenesis protein n=1 Tax=Thermanaerothrix solaris TaxID=3058434 RepID=A0ABU3NPB4_9CHLR|nr:cytochrome c-type biogenesis protein CcmH [Thermanaerothrix sp. 4228-RoL]MDT8897842.1 cytochrome c-type biogenesis protein CcmH [Thermanaerothrix sp. 4228-RoL]
MSGKVLRVFPSPLTVVLGIVLSLVLVGIVAGWASAQQPTPSDDEVNAIAKTMYCPVCENVPLDVCPTQACAQWRELIRQKLAEGWTEQQIKDYFVAQYGDRVLGEPPRRGLHWLVYVLPPLSFLVGVLILVNVFRNMRRPKEIAMSPGAAIQAAPSGDDPYVQQLEEELRRRERGD